MRKVMRIFFSLAKSLIIVREHPLIDFVLSEFPKSAHFVGRQPSSFNPLIDCVPLDTQVRRNVIH
jgi:hypothetical protein